MLCGRNIGIKQALSLLQIMSKPPVASRPDSKVADAACLMLKVRQGGHARMCNSLSSDVVVPDTGCACAQQ